MPKVRIVGLGCSEGQTCEFCGERASITVQKVDTLEVLNACNRCVGKGQLGQLADLKI